MWMYGRVTLLIAEACYKYATSFLSLSISTRIKCLGPKNLLCVDAMCSLVVVGRCFYMCVKHQPYLYLVCATPDHAAGVAQTFSIWVCDHMICRGFLHY